ncbi:MAG: hypothetical protein ACD_50C00338G0015 [uncultured bacterium]|nr:MAG: hypothetical protein ACD_50C00338G0015 [uncultured bacterium]OGH13460.1 MAG: hypothetical protein A2687_02115 [Candidatus Levybacteria bacterium RIFCSPHIGHO2_01_FULL_38_26]
MLEKKKILGVGITNSTKEKILEYILKSLEKKDKKLFVVTPNPEFLVLANKDSGFRKVLNNADLALPDGVGVILAGRILGNSFEERVTGVDLMNDLIFHVAKKPITVGFLGGRDGVAEKTAECLQKKHPKLKIAFVGEEWGIDSRRSNIDILFVAFGAPKQETWISENLEKIPVRVAIGVGGSFDYIIGLVPRAPLFIRKIGFEWLFRLIIQPWRLKRQLALLEFAWLVLKEKFSSKP